MTPIAIATSLATQPGIAGTDISIGLAIVAAGAAVAVAAAALSTVRRSESDTGSTHRLGADTLGAGTPRLRRTNPR